MLVVNEHLSIPLKELGFTFARSAGPGGQHVNKVNTKTTLRWAVASTPSLPEDVRRRFFERYRRRITKDGELVMTSQRFRDQGRNVADCLEKLRQLLLEVATPPKRRKKTKPSRSSREARLKDKRVQSERKQRRRSVRPKDME
jgi:ribosome-associated protein